MILRFAGVMALAVAGLFAQAPAASIASHPDWPKAKPEDVKSIDAIVAATYDVISGPKGQARDWDRFRSLFVPDGRLIPTSAKPDGHADLTPMTVDQYVARVSNSFLANGFFERGISQKVEVYGNIAHVFTTYESRRTPDDPKPFARGINSFQLLKDGDRYWVVTIYWDAERAGNPIPAKYLP